ncbi:P-loop containing nucleoside triphosphate hydrolase protein [Crucibulum laeve]|uniref:P-loop containing nucleoside triphosphate hydrolase protein n=1 Tax=Crucibulum laeve TaxID=68775 RepID=A0A5C3M5K1_9AGAR|nr:P-loop containing nucleoside triphosphate hydrolase protein [Crucibulum laeve]
MRLAAFAPSIPVNLVSSLESLGIRTDADFLFSFSAYDIFQQLPPGTTSLQDLMQYKDIVAELSAAPGVSGTDLLTQAQSQTQSPKLSTGIMELDSLLGDLRGLIEVSGDRGSGKSTVALNTLLNYLVNDSEGKALWIDTTGGFSVEVASIVLARYTSEPSTALERLEVTLAFDIDALNEILGDVFSTDPLTSQFRFIVIDSITPIISPLLDQTTAHGHAVMIDLMRSLREFCQTQSAVMLVINNTAAISQLNPEHRKPALGPSFAFISDATLWLELREPESAASGATDENGDCTRHSIEVLRSKVSLSGKSRSFQIQCHVIIA